MSALPVVPTAPPLDAGADPTRRLLYELLQEYLGILREPSTRASLRKMLRSKDAKTQAQGFGMLFDAIGKLAGAQTASAAANGEGGVRIFLGGIPRPEPAPVIDVRAIEGAMPRPGESDA